MASPQEQSFHDRAAQRVLTDEARLRALRQYGVHEADVDFDRIADWAADLFNASVGVVNFVGEDAQSFVGTCGIESRKSGLEHAFCVHTIRNGHPTVFEDLESDQRFSDNPLVRVDGFRFYAGAPITTPDGHCLGTVFVLNPDARRVDSRRRVQLQRIVRMVLDDLEHSPESPSEPTAEVGGGEVDRPGYAGTYRRRMIEDAQRLASVGGWEYDVVNDELVWTDETYRIHDLQPGVEVDVESALEFYDSDTVSILESNLERIIEKGGRYDLELPITTAEGVRRLVRTIGTAHQIEGETVRVTGAIQDITDRRKVQEELKAQKSVLRTIFDRAPVMIGLFDAEGSPQLLNRQVEDVLGWSRESLENASNLLETLFPDPGYRREIRRFIRAPTGDWQEFRVQTSDNNRVPVEVTTVELPDGRRIAIGIDVSQKRKRQLRLQWAERLAHLGYWAYNVKTEELTWSVETRRIFGWSPNSAVTYEKYIDAVHPEDRERVREVHQSALQGGSEHDIEYRILRSSGEERVLRERGALRRDRHGQPISVVGAALDITEEAERREELRRAKREAEKADRMKTALLSNMNHEFRTPLTAIISFSKIVRASPEMAEDFADRILGGGQRLLRTLNKVMDFAEVEGDQLDPTPQTLSLTSAVESVMDGFKDRAERKGLRLQVESSEQPISVVADPHYIERICTHLVSNAVKFTEEGIVRAIVEQDGGTARITIEDTGIGIPDTFLPHVFDEFTQASTGYDRTHEGNGIGLTTAKRFAERIGGRVDLASEEGKGTRVTVEIPVE